jgi:hypothetical protein
VATIGASRLLILFSAILSICAPFSGRVADAADQKLSVRSGIFTIRIEASKAVYRLGEPIRVRISLHNNTGEHYAVQAVPPWGLCKLVVLNSQAAFLPSKGQYPYRWSMIDISEYPPGRTATIEFSNPQNTSDFIEWVNIAYWGYVIKEPGNYTLLAVPNVRAFPRTGPGKGEYFVTSETDKSDAVHIQVVR